MFLSTMRQVFMSLLLIVMYCQEALSQSSTVSINPDQGLAGTQVTGSGANWPAGDPIQVFWPENGGILASTTVQSDGTFTVLFNIPSYAELGGHNIDFTDTTSRYFLVAVFTVTGGTAKAETGITIEAVNRYAPGCIPDLPNSIANVDNFLARMLSISGYTAGVRFTDANVLPTDFTDPELSSGGADTFKFDRPGDAISYFHGHGTCYDQTDNKCTTTAGCPDMGSLEKRCLRYTENPLEGRCVYAVPREIIVNPTGTICEKVDYSTDSVRWGEDPSAGSWAGAGTNGGINLAVIDNSCGITPDLYIPELRYAFAGVSIVALIMPTRVGSDALNVANRGSAFADRYVANVNSAVALSWTDAINSVTDDADADADCKFGGGHHGIYGCGAHWVISVGVDEASIRRALLTETWVQLRDSANDQTGANWMGWLGTCNYDCINHPLILP